MLDDQQLLRRYASDGSEAAFGELVARHVNLVYSVALRRAGGDMHLAQDVAQLVFTDLARKARSLPRNVVLAGWLHRATRFAAAQLIRTERRRQLREQEAVTMNTFKSESTPDWEQIRPLLDEALDELNRADRDALLLRFMEQRSLAEVGHALGANEDAARKRDSRALDKLRAHLVRRGVTTTAAALSTAITVSAVQVAPAGLAATLTSASLATAAAGTGTTLTLLKFMAMTKLKLGIISAIVVASVATPLVIQHQAQVKLREENQSLRQQVDQLAQLTAENERLSNLVAQANSAQSLPNDQLGELLRLRGEVGMLRKNQSAMQRSLDASPVRREESKNADSASEEINIGRQLGLAVVQGDPDALARLTAIAKAELQTFNTNSARLNDTQRSELSSQTFAPLFAAFDVINEAALKGNQNAFDAVSRALQIPELKGHATGSLGWLAGNGNENALEILLNPEKYGLLLSGTVGALRQSADHGNQRAIEALAAIATDGKHKALWMMAADGLGQAAESGNPVAIDALITLSTSTNQNVRQAVTSGLQRAAANQNSKAAAALRQMSVQ